MLTFLYSRTYRVRQISAEIIIHEACSEQRSILARCAIWKQNPADSHDLETWRYKYNCNVSPNHAMKVYRGEEVQLHSFLTSALDGGEWLTSSAQLFYPRERTPVSNEQETEWALQSDWAFCSYRDSNPGPSGQYPSHYTDYANPESCDLAAALKFNLA